MIPRGEHAHAPEKEMVIQTEIKERSRKMFLGASSADAAQSRRAERWWLRNISDDPRNRARITPISRLGREMVNSILRG